MNDLDDFRTTDQFRAQWLFAPRLLALPLAERAMWGILAAAGGLVSLNDISAFMRINQIQAELLLMNLTDAGLVAQAKQSQRTPTGQKLFIALPALCPLRFDPVLTGIGRQARDAQARAQPPATNDFHAERLTQFVIDYARGASQSIVQKVRKPQ